MAYDEELADRIRLFLGGNMAIAASGQGGILVRVDPGEAEALVAGDELAAWVERGAAHAGSLPPK